MKQFGTRPRDEGHEEATVFGDPPCPPKVGWDMPVDVMERYLEALHAHEWTDTEQPEGEGAQ
ncbi:hypothetical protein OG563_26550 [Nocardia vinacea]|uniref:Uncharacterized protein n=1 Tax=Nocardia vinacea TaxID=96468 RepID=A0ABZ1YHV4_9NOCA|nr:hypothetical protein [Nocardia vinacea]